MRSGCGGDARRALVRWPHERTHHRARRLRQHARAHRQDRRAEGCEVDLRDVADAGDAQPGRYGTVVVGASLHQQHHQKAIVEWVGARQEALSQMPSVFFSVSLSAAEDTEESHAATQRCIDDFRAQTGWTPTRTERIAGCLQYREYDVFSASSCGC